MGVWESTTILVLYSKTSIFFKIYHFTCHFIHIAISFFIILVLYLEWLIIETKS